MSVIKADMRADGREIDFERVGYWLGGAQIFNVSGRLVYDVYCDSKYDGPATIANSSLLPTQGGWYAENGVVYVGARVGKVSPRFVGVGGGLFLWRVSFPIEGITSKTTSEEDYDPETQVWTEDDAVLLTFSASISTEDYALTYDLDGNFNVNSVGEWFAEPIIYKSGILEMRYRRREYVAPLTKVGTWHNAVNSTAWNGFAAGTVKVEISFSADKRAVETLYDVDYKLSWRPRGWNDVKANAGFYARPSAGATPARLYNVDGSPVETPKLLAENGTVLATGDDPVYLTFRTTYPKSFADLDLPNPFAL